MHVFVRDRDLHALKRDVGRAFRDLSHSHACEVLAAALGKSTYASLRTALEADGTVLQVAYGKAGERVAALSRKEPTEVEERLRNLLHPYSCTPLGEKESPTLAALTGWHGSNMTAFARAFDAEFWPRRDADALAALAEGGIAHRASIGFRKAHSPLFDCLLFGSKVGVVPGIVLEVVARHDCIDAKDLDDGVRYLIRFAKDCGATLTFVNVDAYDGERPKSSYGLRTLLGSSGFADVTGFWTSPETQVASAMMRSYAPAPEAKAA